MQPRRGARGFGGGKSANPNAWLGSAWGGAMGRFGAGSGGAKPAVIRVGQTFQADVPPWRGPAALDGSDAETKETSSAARPARGAPPASGPADASLNERPKKSARVEARSEQKNAAENSAQRGPPPVAKPRESEPDRAARLGGIRVWPPEGSLRCRATRASAKSPTRARPAETAPATSSASRVATASDSPAFRVPSARLPAPEAVRAKADPSVKAAAAARAAAAAARAVAASREPRLFGSLAAVAKRSPKKADVSPADVSEAERARRATADLVTLEDAGAPATSETLPPPPASAGPTLVPAPPPSARPSPAEVEIARAHLDGRLRASRSSPALMGLSRMGVASAETCGWTAPSAAAFELALKEKKFSVFAVSRLGAGRGKAPRDPPKTSPAAVSPIDGASPGRGADDLPRDTSADREKLDGDVPDGEAPDPRLAGKSFACMVEYYYNVFLTRPDADDDDDDRSACDEDEFAAAPSLARGGSKRRGAKAPAVASASAGVGVPRSASERELARLGVGETKNKAKKKKKLKNPALTSAEASARVGELLGFIRHAAVDFRAAAAVASRAQTRARDESDAAAAGADGETATPPARMDLKAMAKMTRRWREAWPGVGDAAVDHLRGSRNSLNALKGRTRNRPAADVAAGFSSDEDA